MEDDQSESGDGRVRSASDKKSEQGRRRRSRRDHSGNGGGGPSLKGIITFFSIGSGILLVMIFGWLAIQYFDVFSSGERHTEKTRDSKREEIQNKIDGEVDVSETEERSFPLAKKREEVKRLVQQIQEQKAFQDRHDKQLKKLRDHILTIFDFIEAARGKASKDVLANKEKQAKVAEKQVSKLRDQLVNAYDTKKHPKVREKIDTLNLDIIWEIQEEMDAVLDRSR